MYNEIITLVKANIVGQDDIGNPIIKEERRNVFAYSKSIGQNEFYQAAVTKLNPEAKFVIADYLDYQGEQIIERQGYGEMKTQQYRIIRAYRIKNELELTCRKEMGI